MFTIISNEANLEQNAFTLDADITTTDTILNGYVAHLNTDGDVLNQQAASAIGVFYDFLSDIEPPTAADLVDHKLGKKVNVVMGRFVALMDSTMFSGATVPSAPLDAIYGDSTDGLLKTSGTNIVGTYLGTETTRSASGDVTLYKVQLDFVIPAAT